MIAWLLRILGYEERQPSVAAEQRRRKAVPQETFASWDADVVREYRDR